MKEYSKAECDALLRETVRQLVESIITPPLEESWARFEKKFLDQAKAQIHADIEGQVQAD